MLHGKAKCCFLFLSLVTTKVKCTFLYMCDLFNFSSKK